MKSIAPDSRSLARPGDAHRKSIGRIDEGIVDFGSRVRLELKQILKTLRQLYEKENDPKN